MRVTEKLLLDNNRKKLKQNRQDPEEETMTYKPKEKTYSINDRKNTTFQSSMEKGINREKSIFDRTAAFCGQRNE